nr:MAG TPA: Fibrinogen-binding protein-helix closed bundle with left-hand.25A [Caudoviricetes sp.]
MTNIDNLLIFALGLLVLSATKQKSPCRCSHHRQGQRAVNIKS